MLFFSLLLKTKTVLRAFNGSLSATGSKTPIIHIEAVAGGPVRKLQF